MPGKVVLRATGGRMELGSVEGTETEPLAVHSVVCYRIRRPSPPK